MNNLILITEDSKTIAMYEQNTLKNAGYDVIVAHNMDEAKALIDKHKTDITLSIVDINLPDTKDAMLDFLLKKNIPSIAMTGSFHKQLRDKIVDKHVIDYIVLEDDQQLELLQSTVNRIVSNENKKIMIVDDSKSSRFALKNLLIVQNFKIFEAVDAKHALEILRKNTDISIALIDYEMPGMNGAELTRIIRQNYSRMELSILAISVHTTPIVTIEFLKAGANDFITKPYIKEEVLARIAVNIDIMSQHTQLQHEISERKSIEEELKKSQQLAHSANLAKSNFLANMSHEIRTPMNAIISFVDLLCKDEQSSKKLSQLGIIKSSGESLLHIINDILDFSKIESGKLSIDNKVFTTHEPFNHTADLFFSKAKEKDINLCLMIDENLPSNAYGDSTRIKQILSNLISNAIKFSKNQSNIDINVKYIQKNDSLYCSVVDHGIGIAKENLSRVFEVFEQEDTSTTRKYGGSGLGLSISKSLTELMNGSLNLSSTLGKGSKFYFEIEIFKDIQKYEQDLVIEDTKEYDLEAKLNAHVLIVEDNKSNQLLLSILLDDLGLQTSMASDGLEAVKQFSENTYDLILMDENMPNMNGIEATSIIRDMKDKNQIPIVAVTANALKGDRERFIDAGMSDYLSKPIDKDALELMLRKYLTKG